MRDDGWIVVPEWDKFQHYKNRNPPWIKVHTDINSNDKWDSLSTAARGMLVTIWVEYARSGGQLRVGKCMELCGKSLARSAHLVSLNDAGFIRIVASRPLAIRALAREEKKSEKKPRGAHAQNPEPPKPQPGRVNAPTPPTYERVEKLIRNKVISDPVELEAELAAGRLDDEAKETLRTMFLLA